MKLRTEIGDLVYDEKHPANNDIEQISNDRSVS